LWTTNCLLSLSSAVLWTMNCLLPLSSGDIAPSKTMRTPRPRQINLGLLVRAKGPDQTRHAMLPRRRYAVHA
jgi:hypothetical protein